MLVVFGFRGCDCSYLVFSVNRIARADMTSGRIRASGTPWTVVAPISTTLSATSQHSIISTIAKISVPIGAVSSHVACVTTDTTDDVGCEVALFWAVVLSVTNLTAILASLILVVSEGTVKCCKLTKLVSLELVLAFGNGGSL